MPGQETRIHNANLLGAALFCRIHRLTGRQDLVEPALRLARASAQQQREDGSWPYGELPKQAWVDNFHTGYNLGALRSISSDLKTSEFAGHISGGYAFYRGHFFRADGASRYFHNETYPIDIHCVAQSLITLVEFNDMDDSGFEQASAVFDWAMTHMWDDRGFFYYRVLRLLTIRTPYMRWSQAWMLVALTTFLEACRERRKSGSTQQPIRGVRMTLPSYVLITPARNEAKYIRLTLDSVVAQSIVPLKWVIVSDGSTDGTDEIVGEYAAKYPWIELVRMPERVERHFAGKVHAFNAGYARRRRSPVRHHCEPGRRHILRPGVFRFLLAKFVANPRLGVAGTPFREGSFQYDYRFTSIEHVSGQCQLFRRECFADIGGYKPRQAGGVDLVAVTTARLKGWQTRTFIEKPYIHHRQMSTATHHRLLVPFRGGRLDYLLGAHPLWEVCRCIYQTTRPPLVIGGGLRLAGFVWAAVSEVDKQVPAEIVTFRRKEQMRRLKAFTKRLMTFGRTPATPETQCVADNRRGPTLSQNSRGDIK